MKNNTIHIIGDSHAECFDHIDFGNTFKVKHLGGVLAYNLTKQVPEIINYLDNNNINKKNDYIFFTPGEIDIRSHIGFQSEKNNITYKEAVEICVNRYLQTIIKIKKLGYNVGVWGPIASGPDEGRQGVQLRESFKTVDERNKITCFFNDYLKQMCSQTDIIFKTLYYDIPKVYGPSNWDWYSLDGVHLNAGIYYDVPTRENRLPVDGIIPPRQVILRLTLQGQMYTIILKTNLKILCYQKKQKLIYTGTSGILDQRKEQANIHQLQVNILNIQTILLILVFLLTMMVH